MRGQRLLLWALLLLGGSATASAQIRATTEEGATVLLYSDGTWSYLYGHDRRIDDWSNRRIGNWGDSRRSHQSYRYAWASGQRFAIALEGKLFFIVNEGKLEDLYLYDPQGGLVYTYREGVMWVPYDWPVRYGLGEEGRRPRQIGPYTFKYSFFDGKLEQIGDYKIKYRFHDDRVEQIGSYEIRYEFHTGRLSQVGDLQIEYDFLTDGVKEVSGSEPGLQLYFLCDRP